jgi:anti-sigma factor (TIGR02949 family)
MPGENRMQCAEALRVQAYFDGEMDALSAADIERHMEHCAPCRALLQDLEQVRSVLRRDLAYEHAPPALRAGVMRLLDQEGAGATTSPAPSGRPLRRASAQRYPRAFWLGAFGGIGGTALAATLAFFLVMPRLANPMLDELLSAHVRSLMPLHLIDVVSTDKHTVKPWFAGHADVSPVVADFDAQGYRLMGGRADYLDRQRSAVVVYQHGAHVINVFSWAGNDHSLPENATRNGYHFACWRTGDLNYCAVSDTAWDELLGLERLLKDLSAGDAKISTPG